MILTTERLLLREFEESDWKAVLAYQSDPLYLRYNPWNYRTETDVRQFVRMFMDWSEELPRRKFQFGVVLQTNGELIGNCGIRINSSKPWEADIGYEFASHYWGRGYATEVAKKLLAFGFSDLRLHRIWAYCIAENVASERVLEKIGMRYEGCHYETEWMKDRWWDTLQFAILDREWNTRVQQNV